MAEVYIRQRYGYNEARRNGDSDEESDAEINDFVFEVPEGYDIIIFRETVFTIYTNSENFVNLWFSQFMSEKRRYPPRVVGLDIQLLKSDWEYPPVATIQLCIEGRCLVYHMYNATRLPIVLEMFLRSPAHVFVGVNLEHQLQTLQYWGEYEGHVEYRNLVHIAFVLYSRRFELLLSGLAELALEVLREELVMPGVDPDWDYHTLLDEQIISASAGAYVSYRLGKKLFTLLFDRGLL